MPYDLFVFAAVGRRATICDELRLRTRPSLVSLADFLPVLHALNESILGLEREWETLAGFVDEAVASRVVWADRPFELLGSDRWRVAAKRPGSWIGLLSNNGGPARASVGVAQFRGLQWCADAMRRREREALGGRRYEYVLFSRWDQQWLLPFPDLALLRAMDPDAVFVFGAVGEYYANDRFAAVPRAHLGAYFEAWELLLSGEADRAIHQRLKGCGSPVFFAERANNEAFLWARIVHSGARVGFLPTMAYIHCKPTVEFSALRSTSPTRCTSFVDFLGSQPTAVMTALEGTKYPREFSHIMRAEGVLSDAPQGGDESDLAAVGKALSRIFFAPETLPSWTVGSLQGAWSLTSQIETTDAVRAGECSTTGVDGNIRFQIFTRCHMLLQRLLELASASDGLYRDALALTRARLLAAPLFLENWLLLVLVLCQPSLGMLPAARRALVQAASMSPRHPVVRSFESLLAGVSAGRLEDALGGANATRQWRYAVREAQLALRRRRELQGACGSGGVGAWLAFADHLLREDWLLAAAGVLRLLRAELLEDLRPEALRDRAAEVAGVRALEARLSRVVDAGDSDPKSYVIMGLRLEDLVRDAPSREELLDPLWLAQQEARTGNRGQDIEAPHITALALSYMPWWSRLVPTMLEFAG